MPTSSDNASLKPRKRTHLPCNGEWMDQSATCAFFGNIHPATLWRGVAAGRYPKPVKVSPNVNRWVRAENEAARAALIAARDAAHEDSQQSKECDE